MRFRLLAVATCATIAAVALACHPTAGPQGGDSRPTAREDAAPVAEPKPTSDVDAAIAQVLAEAGAEGGSTVAESDPMSLHKETREELLALFSIKEFTEQEKK